MVCDYYWPVLGCVTTKEDHLHQRLIASLRLTHRMNRHVIIIIIINIIGYLTYLLRA